jgi:hypothetical protein
MPPRFSLNTDLTLGVNAPLTKKNKNLQISPLACGMVSQKI